MKPVFDFFRRDNEYKAILNGFAEGHIPGIVIGMCDAARPFFAASLISDTRKRCLILVNDERECEKLSDRLSMLGLKALVYPARDYVFENVGAYSKEFEQKRIAVLKACSDLDFDVIITTPDAASQETMPAEYLEEICFTIERGGCASLADTRTKLVKCGYVLCDVVEGPGQFAVRGGILDIFTPQYPQPFRIDFYGDEVDLIGEFDIETQRRTDSRNELTILPCRELIPDEKAYLRIENELLRLLSSPKLADKIRDTLLRELDDVRERMQLTFADRFFSLIYDQKQTLLDYLGENVLCLILESQKVKERKHGYDWSLSENIEMLVSSGCCSYSTPASGLMGDAFYAELPYYTLAVDLFRASGKLLDYKAEYSIVAQSLAGFGNKLDLLYEQLSEELDARHSVLLLCRSQRSAELTVSSLQEREYPVSPFVNEVYEEVVNVGTLPAGPGFGGGFTLPKTAFTLITDEEGRQTAAIRRRRLKTQVHGAEKIASYADLAEGDIVVHANHGIGRYCGLKTLVTEGVSRDYIKIVYADNGVLYVPCDQLDLVSKYVCGGEGVKLSKMGSSEWQKAKAKAKLAAKDIAKELIKLYAERQDRKGFAFPPDDELQDEFESEFEYSETEGQTRASAEIKADMQLDRPMDRLLCGDVGFGKTEVSLRAAFKCVFSGKQCAILVPTTILAYQHYQTILSRFRGYPVTVRMLSRFVSKAEQASTIADIAKGNVDIVVGTHRLLQKDVHFDDLGLLIVDEEQRFGVKHKETIKMLAQNTDVLTLTATPIPRTLNMALSEIRDMSVLEEAPTDRVPVQTYVLEYDNAVIDNAISRELRRGGQVFYLHNNVEDIYACAEKLATRFPDATVAVGHGKMDKEELSDVWSGMVNGEISILVCTTIIETGVNVPNANTLIIENADRMGLSQLHQIRGRVGRSSRKAYAYLTYRQDRILSEIATKRLEAMREYTEFGSGFKIAMRDLELRGAGNLLGSEQSGHMEAIGYDLYIKILEDAVNELKGNPVHEQKTCTLDVLVDSAIPDEYISSSKIRMDIYRKIAHIENSADYDDLYDELTDRFGDPPRSALNLMNVSLIRNEAGELGFRLIEQKDNMLIFRHDSLDLRAVTAVAAYKTNRGKVLVNAGSKPYFSYRFSKGDDILKIIRSCLNVYSENISH